MFVRDGFADVQRGERGRGGQGSEGVLKRWFSEDSHRYSLFPRVSSLRELRRGLREPETRFAMISDWMASVLLGEEGLQSRVLWHSQRVSNL